MLRPVPRPEICTAYPNLASEISRIQKELYDEDELDFLDTEDEKIRYLQSYDALLWRTVDKDCYYKVLSFHDSNLSTFTSELAQRLGQLMLLAGLEMNLVATHLKLGMIRASLQHHVDQINETHS